MSTRFGVDYAWGRPSTTSLKNAGVTFVCRYFSHDTTGKNLNLAEAERLSKDFDLVTVWETTAKRPLSGHSAGVQDAKDALVQAKLCKMPDNAPIFFAADWDVASSQMSTLVSYLKGANEVLHVNRTGLYGGVAAVRNAFNAGVIAYGWQTYAWSGGKWDDRALLQQYSNDHTIGGVGLDYDHGRGNFGYWRVGGVSPNPAPKPTAPPFPGRILHYPPVMGGNDVHMWQAQMHKRGWNIGVDGWYGSQSRTVCTKFQTEKKLHVDGTVGPQTWKATWASPVT